MKRLLQHWVTEQAGRCPDSVAVSKEDEHLSYEELEIQSNRLGHALEESGCKRGDRVCFLMPKVPEAVVSMAGILKADCIYVPLDCESPADRIAEIIEHCRPRCILASGKVEKLLAQVLKQVDGETLSRLQSGWVDPNRAYDEQSLNENIDPEFIFDDLASAPSHSPGYKNSAEDAAHILFASDSKGAPKGTVTSHSNLLAFIRWAKSCFDIQPGDHLSNYAPLHSDLSGFDIYGALSSGAQLHMMPQDYAGSPYKVADFISKKRITQWFSVPSVLNEMAESDLVKKGSFPSLKRVIWSRQVFPTPALRYWMKQLPEVSFTNLYGHTETTIASSYYTVPEIPENDATEIPIGKACAGEGLYILDDQLNPVPEGKAGNLFISGSGLSQGYWNDQKRTDEVFLFNPYALDGDRTFYKTGDLACFDGDGLCYYDDGKQEKTKGSRHNEPPIDLTDVEHAINKLQLTSECAVVALPANGNEGQVICCAYVPAGTRNNHIAGTYLAQKLKDVLPAHMIPRRWDSYMILPKNKNGEIHRNKIKNRFQTNEITTNA